MAENTKIEWTDATVSFWWGCTKIGPGCDHCYAEAWDKRTGGAHFGQGVARRKIKSAVKTLHRLDNDYSWWAADLVIRDGEPFRKRNVFVQSMSDLFDNEVPIDWFAEAWQAITACDRVNIQIVTKRLPMVEKRLSAIDAKWPGHAGLIATVVNQEEADRDVPRLLALKAKLGIPWVGLSVEPMLGPIRLSGTSADGRKQWNWLTGETGAMHPDGPDFDQGPKLDWVICGGESGPHARPMRPDWARSLRDQCNAAGVAFHFKQWGEWLPMGQDGFTAWAAANIRNNGRAGKKWLGYASFNDGVGGPTTQTVGPIETINVGDMLQAARVGKRIAGRKLDGRTWDELPGVNHG